MSFETGEWSLAKDKELIDKLEKRSAGFLAPLSEIPRNLDQLTTETAQLNLLLQNVIGDLNTLSERRFIENRVADAHDEKPQLTPEPDLRPTTDEQLREAVRTGLKAFGLLPVEELNDDDDRETGYECFARDRPFSLIIGSKQWLEADPFEGIAPVETVSVGGTPISEAMEDLVLPSTSTVGDDVEEATEAEAWYQKERASISTPGDSRAVDSDSESSVISAAPRKSTLPPALTELTSPNKPRGLFDEDSDDDGDLFGVSKKPVSSSLTDRGSRPSLAQLPESRRGSAASLLQEAVQNVPETVPGPVSFLDELKKKTGQRSSADHRDVKSPPTPTGSGSRETLPSTSSQPQLLAQKRGSIFDSDSESDIFATTPKPTVWTADPNSNPGSGTSLSSRGVRQQSNGSQKSGKLVSDERPIKPSLLETDSEEEAPREDSRKQSLPKIRSPRGSAAQILPKLPKRNSLFDESDSDSDIFGPSKKTPQKVAEEPHLSERIPEAGEPVQVVKPRELKGVRVLPQIKETKTKEVGKAPLPRIDSSKQEKRRSQLPSVSSLESVVKPHSSDSGEEDAKPETKRSATRPQLFPLKTPDLFGDSDSDDELFGASRVARENAGIRKTERKSKEIEETPKVTFGGKLSDDLENSVSHRNTEGKSALKLPADPSEAKTLAKSPPPAPPTDPVALTKSGKAQTPQKAPSQEEFGEGVEEQMPNSAAKQNLGSKKEEIRPSEKSNIFSADSDSGEDSLQHSVPLSSPNRAENVPATTGVDVIGMKHPRDEAPERLQKPDQKPEPAIVDPKQISIGGEQQVLGPLGLENRRSSSSSEGEPVKSMDEKTSTVKKIGMGLPVGFLQGLKARQQQLGLAQPEPKRHETTPESKIPSAQPSVSPQSSSGSGLVALKSDHKDIVEIAKNRVKGPTGRRLPTRSAIIKNSEINESSKTDGAQVQSAQSENEAAVTEQSISENVVPAMPTAAIGQTDFKESEPVIQPQPSERSSRPKQETVRSPLSGTALDTGTTNAADTADSKETPVTTPGQHSALETGKAETAETARPKPKSIFASDSSDEDLFAPKAPPRKKSLPKEPVAAVRSVVTPSIPVANDPLTAPISNASDKSGDEPAKPVAPKRAAKPTSQSDRTVVESPKAATTPAPRQAQSKSLFSESEDDDDGLLFGSKKTKGLPKSATTSSLSSAKEKPKLTQSKSASTNLFGSDSDSDELFKKK